MRRLYLFFFFNMLSISLYLSFFTVSLFPPLPLSWCYMLTVAVKLTQYFGRRVRLAQIHCMGGRQTQCLPEDDPRGAAGVPAASLPEEIPQP